MYCPLCNAAANVYTTAILLQRTVQYTKCPSCDLVFLNPQDRLPVEEEKQRYRLHKNDVHDPAYRNFVAPVLTQILQFTKPTEKGLDFGAGPGPVLTQLLRERGYQNIDLFDPVFYPHTLDSKNRYDFIFANEVIEHLVSPGETLRRVLELLAPDGHVFFGTGIRVETESEFQQWHYRRDPTHICFYSVETAEFMAKLFGLELLFCEGNLIAYRKSSAAN